MKTKWMMMAASAAILWAAEGIASSPIASDSKAMNEGNRIGRLLSCGSVSQQKLQTETNWAMIAITIAAQMNPDSIIRALDVFEEAKKKALESPNSLHTCEMAEKELSIREEARKKMYEEYKQKSTYTFKEQSP